MAKKFKKQVTETKKKRDRIVVAIYSNEFEQIEEKIGNPASHRTIREYLGLKPVAKTIGLNAKLRNKLNEKLKEITEEEKEKLLEEL